MTPFPEPVYVTRPILPDLDGFLQRLKGIWESKWLTNYGAEHRELEARLLRVLKVPHLSLFNNGTTALMVASRALFLKGEVITTPFTFPATPHVLEWNHLTPVFCDIDPVSMTINPDRIDALVTPRTVGVLAVHVYGTPCDVHAIEKIARARNLRVLYDAAHAFGVEVNGVGIGNFGDASMMSFHATKLFHTGEGGVLTYKQPELRSRIELLKNFGIRNEEEVDGVGINGKMTELQAALGVLVLDCLEKEIQRRSQLDTRYRECLMGVEGITLLPKFPGVKNSLQYFVIRINKSLFSCSRDEVHKKFKEYNVFSRKYFYPLCSEYPCYKGLPSSSRKNLPVATAVSEEVLCLPFHGGLSDDDVSKICELMRSFRK